jgi:hypothetical protein
MKADVRFMKLNAILQCGVASGLIVAMTGCATPNMRDRANNAKDIFTATVGWGAGAKARIGPVNAGLFVNGDRAGLRVGRGFTSRQLSASTEMVEMTTPLPVFPGLHGGWFGLHSLEKCDEPCSESKRRNKGYCGFGVIVPGIMDVMDAPAPYYSQVEIAGGCIVTVRLGFNPGELLDFLLGWGGIDIYNDDVETRRAKGRSNQATQATGAEAEPQP